MDRRKQVQGRRETLSREQQSRKQELGKEKELEIGEEENSK